MALSLVFRQADDGALVAPPHCGLLTVPDFLAQVQRCTAEPGPVVVDLSEVVDFDIAAFRALVWARRYCNRRGVRFVVVAPPPGVLAGPHETLLGELLPVYPDRESASSGRPPDGPATATLPAQRQANDPECAVVGCGEPVRAGGRCSRHLMRRLRYRSDLDRQPP